MIYKGATLSALIFAPKPFSLPSLLNPQPRSMKIHWSSVQIFQLHLLQVWTRFVKFGEIHSNPSPKILSKIRQPLGTLSGHLTKSQPQENFSSQQIILSNTWRALSMSSSEIQKCSSVIYCHFLQKLLSISTVPRWRLAPRPLPLVPAPHERLDACGRRRPAGGGAPPRD